MPAHNFYDVVEQIIIQDSRYRQDVYAFMNDAVLYTIRECRGETLPPGKNRHVSGPELIAGAVRFAEKEYGFLARSIFQEWGLTEGKNFGDVVFNMIHANLLTASPTDSPEDFRRVGEINCLFTINRKNENSRAIPPPVID